MPTMTLPPVEAAAPHLCFSSLNEYMREHIPEMAARLRSGLTPLFDIARDGLPRPIAEMLTERMRPYPAQAVTIAGAIEALKRWSVLFVVGEMGTGKTLISLETMRLLSLYFKRPVRAVMTCPNQLPKKWRKHAETIMPGCRVVIVNHWEQLIELKHARTPKQNELWILPRDKSKMGYSFRLAVIRRVVPRPFVVFDQELGREVRKLLPVEEFQCPSCGHVVEKQTDTGKKPVDVSYFGKGRLKKHNCQECGEPLWQANNGSGGCRVVNGRWEAIRMNPDLPQPGTAPRKIAPVDYIARARLRFDAYIPDEVHELKGETLQGQMFATLASRSTKILPLTGTLVGGYATNLLHILWRTMPARLVRDGLIHTEAGYEEFERRYGVLQEQTVYVKKDKNQTYSDLQLGRGKVKSKTSKSLPGISPLMFTKFLLSHSVYIRLAQMVDNLPPFFEHVHQIPMLPEQRDALISMKHDYNRHCDDMRRRQEPVRCWSRVRHCFLRWPDRPWPEQTVFDWSPSVGEIRVFDVPALDQSVEYPKERRLRRLIQRERRKGRRVWVFTELTGETWDVTPRLVSYLAQHGITAQVLRAQAQGGPKPEDREEWIARHGSCDVMISNPNLVKTGLDLYDFPTIIFAFCGDSTYTLRQASRRAWRLGQKHECNVHYLVYSGEQVQLPGMVRGEHYEEFQCLQAAALSLMAQKMDAALTLEGDFSAEGLAAMNASDDLQSRLAKVIAGSLILESPKEVMARYRRRLEASMPSIVREAVDAEPDAVTILEAREPQADAEPEFVVTRIVTPSAPAPVPDTIRHVPAAPQRRVRPARKSNTPNLGALLAMLDRSAPDIADKLRSDLQTAQKVNP